MQTDRLLISLFFGFACLLLPAQTPSQPSSAWEADYQKAFQYMVEEQLDSALLLMRSLMRQQETEIPADLQNRWRGDTLHLVGSQLYQARKLDESEAKLLKAYALRLHPEGIFDSARAETCNRLGMLYREKSRYEEARKYYEESLAIKVRLHGPDHLLTAHTLNNMGNLYRTEGQFEEALQYYQDALRIYLDFPSDPETQAITYHNVGLVLQRQGQYGQAEEYYQKSLELRIENLPANHPEIGRSWYSLSTLAISRGNYDEALYSIQAAREVWIGSDIPEYSFSDVVLGIIYAEKGDFEQAIHYTRLALEMNTARYGAFNPNVAGMYSNLASMSLMNNQYQDAEKYARKGLEIQESLFGPDHADLKASQYLIGEILLKQGLTEEAIDYFERSFQRDARGEIKVMPSNAGALSQMGKAQALKGDFASAHRYFQQSIDLYRQFDLDYNAEFAKTYLEAAQSYERIGDFDVAHEYLHLGREVLQIPIVDFNAAVPALPSPFVAPILLENLHAQSTLFHRQYRLDPSQADDLDRAWHSIRMAMDLIDSMRLSFTTAGSKELLFERTFPVFETAINLCWDLYQRDQKPDWREKAFQISEKNKSLLLFEALKDHQARQFAGIPDSVLKKERAISSELIFLEKQLFESAPQVDAMGRKDLHQQILKLQKAYDDLIGELEADYPQYHSLKYRLHTASIAEVQSQLDRRALISYFIGDSSRFAFVIQNQSVQWQRLEQESDLNQLVSELRNMLKPNRNFGQSAARLAQVSGQLYQILLADLGPLPSELVIIPDGLLGYIPFDFLPKTPPAQTRQYRDWDYLIRSHTLSYAYSATLHLLSQQASKMWQENRILAFAPSFPPVPTETFAQARQTPGALAYNKKEVSQLGGLLEGLTLVDEQASEAAFKTLAEDYPLIHIASHALVNDADPRYSHIRFTPGIDSLEDGALELAELFNLRLNAEMVVLSACETGLGKLQRGEGIISLARGMSYAGARSVITTLWQVNDAATAEIMTSFYRELQAGTSKSEALRAAKLAYLAQNDQASAHPFYWAAYVPIGNMDPLRPPFWKQWGSYLLLVLLFLVGSGLYLHRRNQTNHAT
jgi:CHAT domain-containing protein/Tfp pilus assembly protein PilF